MSASLPRRGRPQLGSLRSRVPIQGGARRCGDAGIEIFDATPDETGQVDLRDVLLLLGERGLTRLLVEGGGQLAASLLRAGLVDRLVWLHAPLLLGGDGVPSVDALVSTNWPKRRA